MSLLYYMFQSILNIIIFMDGFLPSTPPFAENSAKITILIFETFPNYFSTVYYPPHQQLHFTSRQYDHPKAPCYLQLQINMLGWGGVGLTLRVQTNF